MCGFSHEGRDWDPFLLLPAYQESLCTLALSLALLRGRMNSTQEREQGLSEDISWGMKYLLYLPDPPWASGNKSNTHTSLRLSLPLSSLTVMWSAGAGVRARRVVSRDRDRPTYVQHTGATQ